VQRIEGDSESHSAEDSQIPSHISGPVDVATQGRFARFDSWLPTMPWWILSTALLAVALFKSGIDLEVAAQTPDPAFPLPQTDASDALSYGLPTVVWLLGIQGQSTLIGIVTFVFILVGYFASAFLISRTFTGSVQSIGLIALGLGPTITVLLGNIGRHDFLVIFGAVIVGLRGYRWWGMTFGSLLMFLGNPEQSVVALLLLVLLGLTTRFRPYLARASVSTLIAFTCFAGLQIWANSLGADGRADWLGYHLNASVLNFFGNAYLSIFAGYSVMWILVMWTLVRSQGRDRILLILALIVIPFAVTMITADQTRVFVGVSTAALFALIRTDLQDFTQQLRSITPHPAAWAFVAGAFTPVLEITYRGFQRIPLQWLYDAFVNAGLIERLGIGPW